MRRRKARLSDSADLAQARAQLELRQVELEEARSRLRTARLEFWSLAGEHPPRDPETPRLLELEQAETPGPADAPPARLVQGLAALRETAEALEQKARLGGDGLRTTVDLFAELGLKGRSATPADALARSLSLARKEVVLGVRIEAPLDLDARRTATLGHVHAREAAQARYERQRRESDDELALLRERLADSGRRVALLVRLEQTQLEKLELEQRKLRQGRSTTYRIIEIEDELASSRIRLLETRLEQMEAGLRLSSFSQTPTEG
jgi:outer membrane protein TolC